MTTVEQLAAQLGVDPADVQVVADQFPTLQPPPESGVVGLSDAMVRELRDVFSPGDELSLESIQRRWEQGAGT